MTLSLRLSYASIGLSSWDSCHFETREVTPSESKRLFRESQNDTFTAIKLCEYWSLRLSNSFRVMRVLVWAPRSLVILRLAK